MSTEGARAGAAAPPTPVQAVPAIPAQPTGTGPVRVGEELRTRREALGWDLGEIAGALRIRLAYLQALESGDLRRMPGNAYTLGFLRSYANILSLDPEALCRRFRSEARDINRRPELTFPAPVPERGVPAGAAVLLGLVLIVVVYAGWYHFSSHTSVPAQSVAALPEPPALNEATTPPTARQPSPAVASVMPDGQAARPPSVLPPEAVPAAPVAAPVPGPAVAPVTGSVTGAATGPATQPAATSPAAPVSAPVAAPPAQIAGQPQPAAPPAQPAPAASAPGEIALVAKATSWVQVRRDGHVIYDHIMNAGDRWVLPPGAGQATLTVGNAGGLALATGGVEGQVLGRDGAVMRNVKLGDAEGTPVAPASGSSPVAPSSAAAPPAAPVSAPGVPPGATASGDAASVGLPGDFSGSGARKPPRPHRPPPPASHEMSADDLNARQIERSSGTPAPQAQPGGQ